MVNMIKTLGPYIVVMPGVAFAHARPNQNVYQNSIAIITTKEGINFGNPDNDPVRILFAIAAVSDSDHLKLFKLLASYLQQDLSVKNLLEAKRYSDLNFKGGESL